MPASGIARGSLSGIYAGSTGHGRLVAWAGSVQGSSIIYGCHLGLVTNTVSMLMGAPSRTHPHLGAGVVSCTVQLFTLSKSDAIRGPYRCGG